MNNRRATCWHGARANILALNISESSGHQTDAATDLLRSTVPCATSADVTFRFAESKQAVQPAIFVVGSSDWRLNPCPHASFVSFPAPNNFVSEGTATSAVTRASRTGSLNPTDPSAASGNGNQLTRIFETSSGTGATGKLREERRYFPSGKSPSEQRQTRTTLGCNRERHTSAGGIERLSQ